MSMTLSVNDLFDMAIQIEQDAKAFYREAAGLYADAAGRQFMLDLAQLEGEHEAIFDALRDNQASQGGSLPIDPSGPAGPPLISAAAFVSGIRSDLSAQFTGRERPDEIISRAIAFEKDTIVFLVDMKHHLRGQTDQASVDILIREELGHIVKLVGHLGTV